MRKKPKAPHPKDVENDGHFTTRGGFEIYKLLYGLQGRVGRLEAGAVLVTMLLAAILGLLGAILARLD